MLENEYKAMIDIVSGVGRDEVVDCARIAYKGESPVTYADVDQDFQGNIIAGDTVLTHEEDHKTQQSLDYIFQIKPHLGKLGKFHWKVGQDYSTEVAKQKLQEIKESDILSTDMSEGRQRLEIIVKDTVVEKFLVDGFKFKQLSDHYGLSAAIEII